MRFLIATWLALATAAYAQSEEAPPLEPVDCMSIDTEGMQTLYQNMKDVVLSIQVCASEANYTDAAELYFITWPFLMFNEEATKDDFLSRAYVTALDASLQHYFTGMNEAEQNILLDHFDKIVQTPEYRTSMCAHLTESAPPVIDIRQEDRTATLPDNVTALWTSTVSEYGCAKP